MRGSNKLVWLLVSLGLLLAPQALAENQRWAGGFGRFDGPRPVWHPATIDLEVRAEVLEAEVRTTTVGQGRLRGRRDGAVWSLSGKLGRLRLDCIGEIQGRRWRGRCGDGPEGMVLELIREPRLEREQLKRMSGLFRLGPDHAIGVAQPFTRLYWVDLRDGWRGVLYAMSERELIAGEFAAAPFPQARRITFVGDDFNRIEVTDPSGATVQATRVPIRSESVEFQSDSATLRGDLWLPPGPGPHPAAVWVHGSGAVPRGYVGTWHYSMLERGVAVLAYDKRGVGASEGKYRGDSAAKIVRRADDVAAALRAAKRHPSIDPERVGLFGVSQAGWVIPVAARREPIAFAVTLSGGAMPVSVEGRFSDLATETESFAGQRSVESIVESLRSYRAKGRDFAEDFAALDVPALWLYGDLDRSNPTQLSVELLEGIQREHDRDFTIVRFPKGNHSLDQARLGGGAEDYLLGRAVPGLYRTLGEWLERHVIEPAAARSGPSDSR